MRRRWLAVVVPAFVMLVFAVLLWNDVLGNPVLVVRMDVGTLGLLVGLILSSAMTLVMIIRRQADMLRVDAREEAGRDRLQFLARLDHELKNPLTAIRAGLANMTETSSQDLRQQALASVNSQTLRLSRLVADLRKLAELETRVYEQNPVDLNALLEEAVTIAGEQAAANDLAIRLIVPKAPWPLPSVTGDWDLLFIAVHNLLDNAIKFSHAGNTIEVRAFEDGSSVVIEVADTGIGIPENELPHVWEELYRGATAREIPGSGLGLALVRAIVRRHNGVVTIRSRLGQGTVITMRLPA